MGKHKQHKGKTKTIHTNRFGNAIYYHAIKQTPLQILYTSRRTEVLFAS